MKTRAQLILALVVILRLVTSSGAVNAEKRSGSEDLDEDWYYSIRIELREVGER